MNINQTVVIYESKYGYTKEYARWIGQALSCPVFARKEFPAQDFSKYNQIIYGGGLYAGGVSGIKLITKNWELLSGKRVILFTCGIADPAKPENTAHIRESLGKVLSPEMMNQIQLFHLRGGIDYKRLSFVHKSMMAMLRKMLLNKDEASLSDEDIQVLDTYGKHLDFSSRDSIQPLVEEALGL